MFCTASNAVATCRRRLRWRSAAITFPITNPISSRTARALPQRTAWMRPALRSIVCCDGGTVLRRYEPHRRQILPPRRQMPVLGLRLPQGGPFRQPQLGPSAARFPLLARQPVAQGVDEVVVRELVVRVTVTADWMAGQRLPIVLTSCQPSSLPPLPGRWA